MKRTRTSLVLLIALFALTASVAWAGDAKVQVCHVPPGNPANFHTITISENALQAHLAHGDLAGGVLRALRHPVQRRQRLYDRRLRYLRALREHSSAGQL